MQRVSIHIQGIVQGVGFRPFIHRLVQEHGLSGWIKNSSSGVELELEGERAALEAFTADIRARAPKLAMIERMESEYSDELRGYEDFRILESKRESLRNTLISPDICICDDCLRELRDKGDRRHGYAFINCTNCGPRFTIIKDIPYDRAKTSMAQFPMCPDCEKEYHDINDRRYHAQPDCCPDCGPGLWYLDAEGNKVPGDAIELAREKLKSGGIVAIKGLGGMHLACLAENEAAVKELRCRKHRDEKPFALMCRDVEFARRICRVSGEEQAVLESFRRPIVLLEKKEKGLEHISENGYVGLMLPYTPLHYLLFGEDMDMLVMTSANLSDKPIIYKNHEALTELRGIADGYLLHDREIVTRCDDSLCWVLDGKEYFARRSRGYVPFPISSQKPLRQILSCGAEQKASFSLSRGNYIFPSQHIGDLKNLETLENYTQQTEHFRHMFDISPEALACDLHPDYMSSLYAAELAEKENIPLIKVQHHHAHMAACMADNGLDEKVIGLIWDGTGLGTDGSIWGAELLIGGYAGFERFGSIVPIPLPGGDRAAKEIKRVEWSLLESAGFDTAHIENAETYRMMLKNSLNCPLSSGMGRLFDGVAAILGIKEKCSYEGQAAVLLEAAAAEDKGRYPISFGGDIYRFDWRDMTAAIVSERDLGVEKGRIAARFMNTLIEMAARQCAAAREKSGINTVVLSGGSFQNMYIMKRLPERLKAEGFRVFCHRRLSCSDEGLSAGQLMIANAKLEKGIL